MNQFNNHNKKYGVTYKNKLEYNRYFEDLKEAENFYEIMQKRKSTIFISLYLCWDTKIGAPVLLKTHPIECNYMGS